MAFFLKLCLPSVCHHVLVKHITLNGGSFQSLDDDCTLEEEDDGLVEEEDEIDQFNDDTFGAGAIGESHEIFV